MKFDARSDTSPEKKAAYVNWLTGETVSMFKRSVEDPEGLKAATFLFVNRGHEAGLELSEIAEVLGASIARAGLSKNGEELVLDWAEIVDPLASAAHSDRAERKPWWNFWS